MKNSFLIFLITLFSFNGFSQEDVSPNYKNELYLNLTPFVVSFLNANGSESTLQFTYKRKNKIGAFRFSALSSNKNDIYSSMNFTQLTAEIRRYYQLQTTEYGINLGLEKRHKTKFGGWYYGVDAIARYNISTLNYFDYNKTYSYSKSYTNTPVVQYRVGGYSFGGIIYQLNKRLIISAEIGMAFTYDYGATIQLDDNNWNAISYSTTNVSTFNLDTQTSISLAYQFNLKNSGRTKN